MKNTLIMIVGPTAVGKTDLCIHLAKHFETDIISTDSRQFFKELTIGTAKPSENEMQDIKHHFINSKSISENYNVGDFEKDSLDLLDQLFKQKKVVIATGGSGLYIKILCDGMDEIPEADINIRNILEEKFKKEGLKTLFNQLEILDPEFANKVDANNPQRIMRALEVCLQTGKTYSSFRVGQKKNRPFQIIKIGLNREREELYERINRRMDEMLKNGLIEEAKSLYHFKNHNALKTVGYTEIFDFIDGKYDNLEMIRLLKRNSRRYAKRQMTWFKKDESITWFHPNNAEEIIKFIEDKIKEWNNYLIHESL